MVPVLETRSTGHASLRFCMRWGIGWTEGVAQSVTLLSIPTFIILRRIKCWYSSPYPIEDLLEAASSVNVPTSSSGSKHPKSTSSSASHKASAQSSPRNASAASTSTNPTASKIRLASGRFAPRSKAPTATTPAKSPLAQAETATSDNEPSSTTRSSIKTEEHESQHGLPPTASGSDASLQNAFDGIQPQSNQAGKETGVADATLSRETTATAPDTSIAAAAQSSQQASEEQTAGDVQPPLQEATTAVAAPVEEPKAVPAVPGAVHRSARAVVGKALSSKGTVPLPVAASSRAISPQTPIAPTKKDKLVTTTKLYVCEGCFKYMVHAPSYSLHRVSSAMCMSERHCVGELSGECLIFSGRVTGEVHLERRSTSVVLMPSGRLMARRTR